MDYFGIYSAHTRLRVQPLQAKIAIFTAMCAALLFLNLCCNINHLTAPISLLQIFHCRGAIVLVWQGSAVRAEPLQNKD
jgi:hypothetical protein